MDNILMPGSLGTPRYRAFVDIMVLLRHSAGKTQQQVADILGKPQSFIAKFERGERRMDIIEFLDLVKALDADLDEIVAKIACLQYKKDKSVN